MRKGKRRREGAWPCCVDSDSEGGRAREGGKGRGHDVLTQIANEEGQEKEGRGVVTMC